MATPVASNGSVNPMHDSDTPAWSLGPLFLMLTGEVVFGRVGSGLYGMVVFVIVAVFLAGLMVGRTPGYLGKKTKSCEMQMASIAILAPAACVLIGTAIAVSTAGGLSGLQDRGEHGFTEILYAFASMANNNGSAFAGYGANTPLVYCTGGFAILLARYWVAVPVLGIEALAGRGAAHAGLTLHASGWLRFTVLFGNFAEAMAEGRGKAQAESLRRSRRDVKARTLQHPSFGSRHEEVAGSTLRNGDLVMAESGETTPMVGDIDFILHGERRGQVLRHHPSGVRRQLSRACRAERDAPGLAGENDSLGGDLQRGDYRGAESSGAARSRLPPVKRRATAAASRIERRARLDKHNRES